MIPVLLFLAHILKYLCKISHVLRKHFLKCYISLKQSCSFENWVLFLPVNQCLITLSEISPLEFSRIYICIIDITCSELYNLNKALLKKPLILPSLLRTFEFEYNITFLTRLYTAIPEQLKVGCFFQILFTFHPSSRKSFFMTAICSFAKTIFSNYVGNQKNCQYRK